MELLIRTNAYTNIFSPKKELSLQTYIVSIVLENWRDIGGVLDVDGIHHLGD